MAEDQNNKENTTTSDTNNTSEYEDVCYICRRPEHIAGKMIKIPNNICICQDCMQKTFDSMNQTGFSTGQRHESAEFGDGGHLPGDNGPNRQFHKRIYLLPSKVWRVSCSRRRKCARRRRPSPDHPGPDPG